MNLSSPVWRSPAIVVGFPLAALIGAGLRTWWRSRLPTVVLVVLDTVRADRTSICGYGKPTTPILERLVAAGATVSCGAVAPCAWTLPSHAGFFTGLPVWEHGATLAGAEGKQVFSFSVHPLPDDVPTLAEQLGARGYATTLVSENSVVSRKTGLARGFQDVRVRYRCGKPAEEWLYPKLDQALDEVAHDPRPLFLAVNICQAHDPRTGAPEAIDWLDHHDPTSFRGKAARRFLAGEMSDTELNAWLATLSDAYDWSAWSADLALGRVLRRLDEEGRTEHSLRLVVTSDHGEMLGEHGRIDHMEYLWEPVARVPLLVLSDGEPVALPEQVSGPVVHDLVLDGRLPDPLPDAAAASAPSLGRPKPPWSDDVPPTSMAASWEGNSKRLVVDGRDLSVDLAADPGEVHPQPAPDDARQKLLRERYAIVQERAATAGSAETEDLLKELGYVE